VASLSARAGRGKARNQAFVKGERSTASPKNRRALPGTCFLPPHRARKVAQLINRRFGSTPSAERTAVERFLSDDRCDIAELV
jgi:hypothetical protein